MKSCKTKTLAMLDSRQRMKSMKNVIAEVETRFPTNVSILSSRGDEDEEEKDEDERKESEVKREPAGWLMRCKTANIHAEDCIYNGEERRKNLFEWSVNLNIDRINIRTGEEGGKPLASYEYYRRT